MNASALPGSPWRAARAEQLTIDAAGFVAFGGNHVETAHLGHAPGEPDIGAAAGHVGGDGDLALFTRFGRRF